MWYFAYGSNLCTAQMSARTGPGWTGARRARLPGYRLVFNMTDGSGSTYANIERPGEGVLGVLYWCTPEALEALDRYESGYDRTPVVVWDEVGGTFEAVAYIARPECRAGADPPSSEYVRRIVRGAREHGLPEHYIRSIQAAARISDQPDD